MVDFERGITKGTEPVMVFRHTERDIEVRTPEDLVRHNIWVNADAVARAWGPEAVEPYRTQMIERNRPV